MLCLKVGPKKRQDSLVENCLDADPESTVIRHAGPIHAMPYSGSSRTLGYILVIKTRVSGY